MKIRSGLVILFLLGAFTQTIAATTGVKNTQQLFVENKGQFIDQQRNTNPGLLFVADLPGMKIHVRKDGFSYEKLQTATDSLHSVQSYRTDIKVVNASSAVMVAGEDVAAYHFNYYLAQTPVDGVKGVKAFGKVRLKNIYPKIDLLLSVNKQQLKYEFVVHPGGRASDITLQVEGAISTKVSQSGELEINTPLGEITEERPVSYQDDALGNRTVVSSNFVVRNNAVAFDIGAHEPSATLTIDPSVLWGTYFGGTGTERLINSAVDPDNNMLITGYTTSATYIASAGAFQTTYMGQNDAFIAKFDTGGQLLWATYIGGTANDEGDNIIADDSNHVYMTGISWSNTGVGTPGTYLPNNTTGFGLGILMKFDSLGQRIWGTYSCPGNPYGITVDNNHDILTCGFTSSTTGISTPGTQQQTLAGSNDGFLLKFNNQGQKLWGTYYGGAYIDWATGVITDSHRNIYLCGWSNSNVGLGTPGTHLVSLGIISNGTAFLAKFTPSGVRVWGTYYGCTTDNSCEDVTLVGDTAIYITGVTLCASGITTPGVYSAVFTGGYQRYVGRFDTTGNLTWGTYVVQTQDNTGAKISHDSKGNVVVGGIAYNIPGFSTPDAIELSAVTYDDGYIAIINDCGQRVWGSYVGWAGGGPVTTAVFDHNDDLLVAGYSDGNTIGTPGTYQTNNRGGNEDGYVVKINRNCSPPQNYQLSGDSVFCPNSNHVLLRIDTTNNASILNATCWNLPVGFIRTFSNADSVIFNVGTTTGIITAEIQNGCRNPTLLTQNILVNAVSGTASILGDTAYCTGDSILLYINNAGDSGISWQTPTGTLYTSDTIIIVAGNSTSGKYIVHVTQGSCAANDTQIVTVHAPVHPVIAGDTMLCTGQTGALTATSGTTYNWSTGQSGNSISITPVSGTEIIVTATAGGCAGKDSVHITVNAPPVVHLGNDTTLCNGQTLTLNAENPGDTYLWQNNSTAQTLIASQGGAYSVKVSNSYCSTSDTIQVNVLSVNNHLLGNDTAICQADTLKLNAFVSGAAYHWQDNSTQPVFNVTQSGLYMVTVIVQACAVSDSVMVTVNSPPLVNLGNDTSICFGQILLLNAGNNGATYHWQNNSTAQTFTVNQTGTYRVNVSLNGCSAADSIYVQVGNQALNLGNDTSICAPHTLVLQAQITGASYTWQDNSHGASYTVVQSGIYSVTVIASTCTYKDSIHVTVTGLSPVNVTINPATVCATDSALICAPTGYASYNWNNFKSGTCIYSSSAGNYYVTVTDVNGCTATSNHVALSVLPVPPVSLNIKADTFTAYGAISYQWYLNNVAIGGAVSPQYIATADGSYTVAIVDTNGCATVSNPIVFSAISEAPAEHLKIYPNPATEFYTLSGLQTGQTYLLCLTDITGRQIDIQQFRAVGVNMQFQLPPLPSALYLLQVHNAMEAITFKLMKE